MNIKNTYHEWFERMIRLFRCAEIKIDQSREMPESFRLSHHAPKPFQAQAGDDFWRAFDISREYVQRTAKACRDADRGETGKVFRDPFLLYGKSKADEQDVGTRGADK